MSNPIGHPIIGHVTPLQGSFDALRDKLRETARAAQEAADLAETVETGTATMPEALRCVIALAHAFKGHTYQVSLGPVSDEMFDALVKSGAQTRSTFYEADGRLYTKDYVIEVAEVVSGGVSIHCQRSHDATAEETAAAQAKGIDRRESLTLGTARL